MSKLRQRYSFSSFILPLISFNHSSNSRPSLLLSGKLFLTRGLHAGLIHQLTNRFLQIINPVSHLVNSPDDSVGHLAESTLHLLQQRLHEDRQILTVGGRLSVAAGSVVIGLLRLRGGEMLAIGLRVKDAVDAVTQ